jgi:hypothetical protein
MPTATESAAPSGAPDAFGGFSEADIAASTKEQTMPGAIRKLSNAVIQHMADAGLIPDDEKRGALLMAKRLSHALYADEPLAGLKEARDQFWQAHKTANGDIAKLTEGRAESAVFKLVKAYLTARMNHYAEGVRRLDELPQEMGTMEYAAVHERASKKYAQYKGELEAYERWPQIVNDVATQYPQVISSGKYQRLGDLAVSTGIVEGDPASIRDKINDVMAEVTAKRMLDMAPAIMTTSKDALQRQKEFPAEFKTNIIFRAEDTALHTTGLERLNLHTAETGDEVEKMQAMERLLSAHLHALTSHTRNYDGSTNPPIETLASNHVQIPGLVRSWQSAALSSAYLDIKSGPGANDPNMKKLADDLKNLMEKRNIVLQMNPSDVQKSVQSMVNESAGYLRAKFNDKPELLAKVDTLAALATGKAKAEVSAIAPQNFVPPSTFAEAAKNTAAATIAR